MTDKKEILGVSTITYKFQLTIPKKVRERFNLKEKQTVVFVEEDGKLLLTASTLT